MDNIVIVCEWSGLYRSVFIVTCVYFKKYLTFAYRYIILLYIQKEGDDKVSPRTGRPTDNPKTKQMPIRFSEDDINKNIVLKKQENQWLKLSGLELIRYIKN